METPDIVVTVKGNKSTVVSAPSGSATRLVELSDVTATPRANGDVLTFISANGKFEFHPDFQSSSFGVVAATNQASVVANTSNDTLTLIAGTGIVFTTNTTNKSIDIAATGTSAIDGFARTQANNAFDKANIANVTGQAAFDKANDAVQVGFVAVNVAGQSDVVADSSTDTLTLIAGAGILITTDAANDTITFATAGGSSMPTGNSGDAIFYENRRNVTANYTITVGTSAMSTGPITLNPGVMVTLPPEGRWVII